MWLEVVIAVAGSVAAAGGLGVALGRTTAKKYPVTTETTTTAAPDVETHVHEATTVNSTGWFCKCGKHYHRYVFADADRPEKQCQCGEWGTEDQWQGL